MQEEWTMLFFVVGYGLGSVPFGLILTRLAGMGDIRSIGSGNIGATNVLRTGNKRLALATLLLDGVKGLAAVVLAAIFMPEAGDAAAMAMAAAGIGAVLGHVFPVWLGFKGGKGVATAFGVMLGFDWLAGLAGIALWMAVAAAFRYSSFAALVAMATAPLLLLTDKIVLERGEFVFSLAVALSSALVIARHHANIVRLIKGTEPQIGKKDNAANSKTPT